MKNFLIPLFVKVLGLLPLGAARWLGAFAGWLMWLLRDRNFRVTEKNIACCFPQLNAAAQRQLVRESLRETGKTAIEAALVWRHSWVWLQTKIIAVEGEDILRSELAAGKGLVVLAPHLGNWEVVAPYLASIAPLTAMYKPFPIAGLDKLIFAGRSKLHISMAPTNRKGVTMLLKALQQGTIVGILPDQVPEPGTGAEPIPIFGQRAMTMSLVTALINRTHSRVVAVFAMRIAGGFKLITLPAAPEIYSQNPLESMRGLNLSVEACVNLAPAQYQWEYKRFRRLPADDSALKNSAGE
jgi:Kdo2-lipid IVA lauroyltransferase/acyltransferase